MRAVLAGVLAAWWIAAPVVAAPDGPGSGSAATSSAPADASAEARAKAPVVSDGTVAITTRLSPEPSNIGDRLELEIVAAHPRDVRVNLPTKLHFAPLHLVDVEEDEPEPTGDELRKVFRVYLQCFTVGEATIPGFPVTYVDAQGGIHTVDIPPRTFVVQSLLANEADPQRKGEDPPISREYPDTTAEIVIWSTLATLLAALVAFVVVTRLRARRRPVLGPPPIPPHLVAFEALDELERGELLASGQVQRYYVELTEIAKGYIEGRFGMEALDRTTEEIRQQLRRDPGRVAPLSADEVIEFLEECDLVKFARLQPPDTEARGALGTVRRMVEGSIPDPKAEAAKAEAAKAEAEKAEAEKAEAAHPEASKPDDEPATIAAPQPDAPATDDAPPPSSAPDPASQRMRGDPP